MSTPVHYPWLSVLLLVLLAGAALVFVPPKRGARWVALLTTLLVLALSLWVAAVFDSELAGFRFVERLPLIPAFNIHYLLGVDGLSVLFLPFTALLFCAVVIASWNAIRIRTRLFFALLLLFEFTLLGVFTALDTLLFTLFWVLSLPPLYILLSLWGGGLQRRYMAGKYLRFMLSGSVALLGGFVLLALQHPSGLHFAYPELAGMTTDSVSYMSQLLIFLLLLAGVAVRIPLLPLHGWLPLVAQQGAARIIALLLGVNVGVYALLRFVLPLVPEVAQDLQWLLMILSVSGMFYAALMALGQGNLRNMLAYFSLSVVSFIVLGIVSFNQQGMQGAVFQLLNLTLVFGGLFISLGYLQQRIGSCDLLSLGGLSARMPLLTAGFFLLGMTGLGMPGTAGFPAEFLLFIGVLKAHPVAGLPVLLGILLGAGYFLSAFCRAFFGAVTNPVAMKAPDLKHRELLVIVVLIVLVSLSGVYPQPVLDITAQGVEVWLQPFVAQP